MVQIKLFNRILLAAGGLTAVALAACSSSSDTSGPGAQGGFQLVNVSVSNGITWQINRAIRFVFNDDVDFSTVNNNSINIVRESGQPALGSFVSVPGSPHIVEFRPACPTNDSYSDAGLLPGNVRYNITVLGKKGGSGIAVTSKAQQVLQQSQTRFFFTPDSVLPSDIFQDLDPTQGAVPAKELIDLTGDGIPDVSQQLTYLELGGDSSTQLVFSAANLGTDGILLGEQGLNLYSDQSTRVAVVLELNQPVNPSSDNINTDRIRLEFRPVGTVAWTPLSTRIELVRNCSETGATVRLEPSGILPQGSEVRVVITTEFEDLVGQRNPQAQNTDFVFRTETFDNPAFAPNTTDRADEVFEPFTDSGDAFGSLEDEDAPFAVPLAEWGGGKLKASFAFNGDGGPGGTFDMRIAPNTSLPLDTTFAIVSGGDNFGISSSQAVVGGVLNVRNLRIEEGGTLQVTGPNPLIIQATGKVEIFGRIEINGGPAKDVATLGTGQQPETGAAGVGGGGKGGDASTVTNNSTPRGTNGSGAFQVANLGGRGGESGFASGANKNNRRPGGGGGGSFGPTLPSATFVEADPDPVIKEGMLARLTSHYTQTVNGTDFTVSPGFGFKSTKGRNGSNNGKGAVSNQSPAQGGDPGPLPFFDTSAANDFWGTRNVEVGGLVTVIQGELKAPHAGAGGGGAGDAIQSAVFPPKNWLPDDDEKGGGGGGGAGQLQILALGDIVFSGIGTIEARGGRGASGENTINFDHVGGGGGGGSGGHVIIQTPAKIDFSGCDVESVPVGQTPFIPVSNVPTVLPRAISAFGGRGAEAGTSNKDENGTFLGSGAGGDGGPGIIQLHVLDETDILLPFGVELRHVTEPPPVLLVPTFGGVSRARSKWISLGGASLNPSTPLVPDLVRFRFGGTQLGVTVTVLAADVSAGTDTFTSVGHGLSNGDVVVLSTDGVLPTGLSVSLEYIVLGATADTFQITETLGGFPFDLVDSGTGTLTFRDPASGNVVSSGDEVQELSPILSSNLPVGNANGTLLTVDATSLLGTSDDIYLRNPNLLRNFTARINGTQDFEILQAIGSVAEGSPVAVLTLVLDSNFVPTATFNLQIVPRYFRVITNSVVDDLPDAAHIKVEFQGTNADADGNPVEPGNGVPFLVPWTADIAAFNQVLSDELSFFRFRVEFDIGDDLSSDTPIPTLDFIRIPFVF